MDLKNADEKNCTCSQEITGKQGNQLAKINLSIPCRFKIHQRGHQKQAHRSASVKNERQEGFFENH